MKIVEANGGALTNFEVFDLLRSRGAGRDPTRAIASVSPSEFKVFDYLEQTVACNQSRESFHKFVHQCKKFDLAKAEILNIVNTRPTSEPEIFPIIEGCESNRMEDKMEELIETITQILPPHPTQVEESNEEEAGEGIEETAEGKEETEIPEPNTT